MAQQPRIQGFGLFYTPMVLVYPVWIADLHIRCGWVQKGPHTHLCPQEVCSARILRWLPMIARTEGQEVARGLCTFHLSPLKASPGVWLLSDPILLRLHLYSGELKKNKKQKKPGRAQRWVVSTCCSLYYREYLEFSSPPDSGGGINCALIGVWDYS